jgi:hypothetical protein
VTHQELQSAETKIETFNSLLKATKRNSGTVYLNQKKEALNKIVLGSTERNVETFEVH